MVIHPQFLYLVLSWSQFEALFLRGVELQDSTPLESSCDEWGQ